METPPSLPKQTGLPPDLSTKNNQFPRYAAMFSLCAPLMSLCIGILVQPQVRGIRMAMMIFGLLQMLLIISGFILGITALVITKKEGRAGVFGRAIAGTCINGLLVLSMLISIPALMKAKARAQEMQRQNAERQQ